MKARRRGTCPFCKKVINEGDEIAKRRGRWGHASCVEEASTATAATKPPNVEQVYEAKAAIIEAAQALLFKGAPVVRDDQGYNGIDYGPSATFMQKVEAGKATDIDYGYQARRLGKYRRQLTGLGLWENYALAAPIIDAWLDHQEAQERARYSRQGSQPGAFDPGAPTRPGASRDRPGRSGQGTGEKAPGSPQNRRRDQGAPGQGSTPERPAGAGSVAQVALDEFEARYDGRHGKVQVFFPYDPRAVEAVKTVEGRRWNPTSKCWSVPLAAGLMLADAIEALGGPGYEHLAAQILALPKVKEAGRDMKAASQLARTVSVDSLDDAGRAHVAMIDDHLAKVLPDGFELFPFQSVGVSFMVAADGRCIVGDEMGTGKTIEALAFLLYQVACGQDPFPCVIVVPAVVKRNWQREARTWLDKLNVNVFVCDGKIPAPDDADVVVINYDIMRKRVPTKKGKLPGSRAKVDLVKDIIGLPRKPRTVICDEFHKVKNPKAKRTQSTLAYAREARWQLMLSGTPMLNRPIELFPSLNVIRPDIFPNFFGYANRYCGAERGRFGWDFSGASNLDELKHRLLPLMLRRLKTEVLTELPAKTRVPLLLDLDNRADYDKAEADLVEWLKGDAYQVILQRLAEEGTQEVDAKKEARRGAAAKAAAAMRAEHLVRMNTLRVLAGKGKAKAATEWIADFFENNPEKKLVVGAHHLDVIGAIRDAVADELPGIGIGVITGQTPNAKRQEAIDAFQTDPRCKLMLLSIQAGGVGITLTAAQDVLMLERQWVPGDEEQMEDRCHRIGQEGAVSVYYGQAENSIDEDFAAIVDSKRAVFVQVMGDGEKADQGNVLGDITRRMFSRHRGNLGRGTIPECSDDDEARQHDLYLKRMSRITGERL